MLRKLLTVAMATGLMAVSSNAFADGNWGKYQVGETRSGYTYAAPETQAIQDDDFENPGFIWVDYGDELWSTADGAANKSCADCHSDASESMANVGTTYPVYNADTQKPINVEQRINKCRKENMQADPWKYESKELLSMTAFIRNQSSGMPLNTDVSGAMAPFFEKGKAFFYKRRGQLDLSCANCHEDNAGGMLRANLLSQGQINGFPTYRLKWQKPGSTHRRFRGCNKQVRSQPYRYGSDEYVNLEVFLMDRGRGLPVEAPAIRN